MRTKFDQQLDLLNVEMIKMGALCEDAISKASKALMEGDSSLLPEVFEVDSQIDRKERDIEVLCMKLLLQQQPVARDLRTISSALKMISDMERIGDQAADIAEILQYIGVNDTKSKIHIGDMAAATIKMVTESIDSFVKKDIEMVQAVIAYDDVVDDLFDEVKKELCDLLQDKNSNGELCLDLLMIAKYFERIGDHATNVAEWVCYSITGIHKTDED